MDNQVKELKGATHNFSLRMARAEDAEALLHLVESNRERIGAYFPGIIRYCDSASQLQDHLRTREEESKNDKYIIMLIVSRVTQDILGLVQLKDIDQNARKREIGAFVDGKSEGKRVMIEALRLLIDREFTDNRINKLFLRTAETNQPARRLAEKLGFRQEGLLREDFRETGGNFINLFYYGLLKSDWEKTAVIKH